MDAGLEAALRFLARVDGAVAGERVRMPGGVGLFDPARPLVWDANYVRVERTDGDARSLAGLVEPLFAARELAHRQVVVPSERQALALQPGFESLNWRPAHELIMATSGTPPASPRMVEEVSLEELRYPVREIELMEPPGGAGQTVASDLADQLAGRGRLVAAVTGERRFAVREDGVPVAWCRLYAGDGIGQIEQVMTHPDHRNRGCGRAVVAAATAASHERNDRLTFLVALADDWPRKLYGRLGFETLGTVYRFRMLPATQRASSVPS
jgi:GNAT superfamily N-acetyltransferase